MTEARCPLSSPLAADHPEPSGDSLALILAELRELRAVVAALTAPALTSGRLVDVATLAAELGVSRRYVYEHAAELGAVRLGDGPKPRIRFDLAAALTCSAGKRSAARDASTDGATERAKARGGRSSASRVPKPGSILAVRPREARRAAQ